MPCSRFVGLLLVLSGLIAPSFGQELPRDREDISTSAREILEAPEFQHFQKLQGESVESEGGGTPWNFDSDRKIETPEWSLPDWVGGLLAAIGNAVIAGIWFIVGGVALVIVYLIVRAALGWDMNRAISTASGPEIGELDEEIHAAPGDLAADDYLRAAQALAAEGQFREAIAHLMLGAMSHMERTGMIRYRHGLTYRDYLRAARASSGQYDALRTIVRTYEPLGFGRREATQAHFETSLSSYDAGFRTAQ